MIITEWYPKRLSMHIPHLSRAGIRLGRVTVVLASSLLETAVLLLVAGDSIVGNTAQSVLGLASSAASIAGR
jgi:hypothetical protein